MKNKSYNYSIQLMKLLLAFFVVVLHILGHGGILQVQEPRTFAYYFYWFIESFAYVAVNCFMISTGFFLVKSNMHISKVIYLYFVTLFYCIVGIVTTLLFKGTEILSLGKLISIIFPLSSETYGFVTTYIAVYLLSPILNKFILNLTQNQKKLCLFIILIFFSLFPTIRMTDYLQLNYGMSFLWFTCLYITGGIIKTESIFLKYQYWFLIYIIICIFQYVVGIIFAETANFLGLGYRGEGILLHYNSITVFIASIALFCFFAKNKVSLYGNTSKIFVALSKTTLGVYLLSDNPDLRSIIWKPAEDKSVIYVIFYAIIIWLGCTLFDLLRDLLFKAIKVNSICEYIQSKLYLVAKKVLQFLKIKINYHLKAYDIQEE